MMGMYKLLRKRSAVLWVTLAFSLAACLPESTHPISDPATAEVDQRLAGMWFGGPPNEPSDLYFASFLPQDDNTTDILTLSFEEGGGEWIRFSMTPSTVGDHTYMNILYRDQSDDDDFFENYLLCYYFFDEEGRLQIWSFSNERISEAIENGLPGTVKKGSWVDDIKITASSEELQAFLLSQDPKELFTEPVGIYKNIGEELIGVVKAEGE